MSRKTRTLAPQRTVEFYAGRLDEIECEPLVLVLPVDPRPTELRQSSAAS
jgi:hypothetical protein